MIVGKQIQDRPYPVAFMASFLMQLPDGKLIIRHSSMTLFRLEAATLELFAYSPRDFWELYRDPLIDVLKDARRQRPHPKRILFCVECHFVFMTPTALISSMIR